MATNRRAIAMASAATCAIVLLSCVAPSAQEPQIRALSSSGELSSLRTEGKNVIAQDGGQVVLCGPTFSGWLQWDGEVLGLGDQSEKELRRLMVERVGPTKTEAFFTLIRQNLIDQQDFAQVKAMGWNAIRLPFSSQSVQKGDFALLDKAVEWASSSGLYLILDMQAAEDAREENDLLSNSDRQAQFIQHWETIASRFKDKVAVAGYELLHEPATTDMRALGDLYRKAVARLRRIDERHLIFLDNIAAGGYQLFSQSFGDNIIFVLRAGEATKEVKQLLLEGGSARDRIKAPLLFNGNGGIALDYRFTSLLGKAGALWTYSSYKRMDNSHRTPFYYSTGGNPWKKWISTFAQTVHVRSSGSQVDKSAITRSALSPGCKNELQGILKGGESRDELLGLYRQLSARYPDDASELKNVLMVWQGISAAAATLKQTVSPQALVEAIKSLDDAGLSQLTQALKTQFWSRGQDQLADQRDENKVSVRKVCRLVGKGHTGDSPVDSWGVDLGVMFAHRDKIFLLGGDCFSEGGGFAPNIIGWTTDHDASDGLDVNWEYLPGNKPKEFFPLIPPTSTAPAGAIAIENTIYIFMMDVSVWDNEDPPYGLTHARCVLIKSTDGGNSFAEVWQHGEMDKLVNVAPIIAPHPEYPNRKALYLLYTNLYRHGPIYLAVTDPSSIEDRSSYQYFSGLNGDIPAWTGNPDEAVPIVGDVGVGELSVAWNDYLDQWLLAYFDFSIEENNYYFQAAPRLWGPWGPQKLIFTGKKTYNWYETYVTPKGETRTWAGAYGGYLLHELDRKDGQIVYFNLSLWFPYSIFLMEVDLKKIFG